MALLDEARREPELEQGDRERGGQVVQVGAGLGELQRFHGLVEELVHRLVQLLVEQLGHGSIHSMNGAHSSLSVGAPLVQPVQLGSRADGVAAALTAPDRAHVVRCSSGARSLRSPAMSTRRTPMSERASNISTLSGWLCAGA